VSLGREFNPITIVNGVDNLGVPEDFTYVADYVETNTININRVITSLRVGGLIYPFIQLVSVI